jgi:outer membrane protein OmpA-like peptidoglycan-associated protein
MPMAESCARFANGKGRRRQPPRLAVLAVLLGLSACNPVDTWRDLTGISRNDPDPETTPNTKNLAAGEASDYPNLATVPAPPVRALTTAEREKLTQSLIADRANARHTDEQLRAGFPSLAAAPPPPPGAPGSQPEQGAAASPPEPASVAAAAVGPSALAAAPSAAPTRSGAASERPAKPPSSPSGEPTLASVAGAAGEKPAIPPPGAAPRAAPGGGKAPAEPGQGLRKQGEPPEPGPLESSLQVPQARATPQPEQIEPAPPPPQLPPTPKVATAPTPLPGGLAAGGALAPMPLPQAKNTAGYEPPPAAPELPPPPSRTAAAAGGKGASKPPPRSGTPVAEIKFGADSTSLTDKDRQTLETVLPKYQENPGKVRIVGYAGAGSGAVEQLDSYRTALDRAQAVAAALTKAGIPSDKIQVEAAPQSENSGESRAEVLLEH